MKVGIVSLGCPKNLLDSENMLGQLRDKGHEIVPSLVGADVVLINTCAFIEEAREESIQMIFELVEMKRAGSFRYLVVCGCLPQKYADDLERDIPLIDAMVGTFSLDEIVGAIDRLAAQEKTAVARYIRKTGNALESYRQVRHALTPKHTRYVKIAEGCDHGCSFCVIPSIRGAYVSRPVEEIVAEVRQLGAEGAREVVLIAQDTSFYGVDRYKKLMLPELLRQLNAAGSVDWIRVLYLYPNHVTDALIDAFAECERVVKYIDMPIQHINDMILERMKRHTTRRHIEELIAKIRARVPGAVLRTSVIVGYPGETFAEFDELMKFIARIKFERLGAFMYSDEVEAVSYGQDGKVKKSVKKSRFQDIMLQQQKISRAFNASLVGREMDVLIDGDADSRDDYYGARSAMDAPDIDCQILVRKQPQLAPGDMVRVKIVKGFEYDLEGTVVR